jgi:hypothetical protein
MDFSSLDLDQQKGVQEILGYLNFSSGTPDPRFLASLNVLFGRIEESADAAVKGTVPFSLTRKSGQSPGDEPAWQALARVLREGLAHLRGTSDAFRRVEQAEAVLQVVFERALPAYCRHHADLLFHQTPEQLFRPLFIGRMCEAVLQQGGPWDQTDRIVTGALAQLNDYLGYRPVPVLRTEQKIQPYAHEWVRPIPVFVRGAGVAAGRYRALIEKALAILQATDPTILFQAFFAPELLDELAVDVRAYDFDHPNNKRPNYIFGQWDLSRLDLSGRCQRFVVQEVALEAMLGRVENRGKMPYEEALFEAAAVLAGTMLMGSGVSGNRPDAHDSTVNLNTLVQRIAVYRDAFYEQLLQGMEGPHAERLRAEAAALRQPFGGARQQFNHHLARLRAAQLQHVSLARVFARMGYTEAAMRQVRVVPVPAARMRCDIHCRLTAAHLDIERGRLEPAAARLPEIEDLLFRAIDCGAMADPWSVLGFGGQYSLFPSPENSIHDQRIDELIETVGEILALYVRVEKEAAAAGQTALQAAMSDALDRFARWWDKYATVEVSGVERVSGRETKDSADQVAGTLRAWHAAGTAAGDLAFWRERAEDFRSPKAYSLVVEALLEHRDPVAAMALLVHWLSQVEEISLAEENYSFHELALLWMEDLWQPSAKLAAVAVQPEVPPAERWKLTRKFLDYLEANADEYWRVPDFELAGEAVGDDELLEEEDGEDEDGGLFGAAYEEVTYRDSTDDGFDSSLFEVGENATDVELLSEAERLINRLTFLTTVAELWKLAAVASLSAEVPPPERDDVLANWLKQAIANRKQLLELLTAVQRYHLPPPRGTHESLVEYDRRRTIQDTLLEQIVGTCIETDDAARMVRAAMGRRGPLPEARGWEKTVNRVLHAAMHGDAKAVRAAWASLNDALLKQPLLYVSLARGGNPLRIVASRSILRVLRRLLTYLPRLGLLQETCWLIETVQDMELDHPVGPGAITEFDQVFEVGCKAIVRGLVLSSETWKASKRRATATGPEAELIGYLEETIEALLRSWLTHSRGVRLSVLETVRDSNRWTSLKRFIERYGHDLFTQRFMNLANLRAILHEGVDAFLESLSQEPNAAEEFRLLAELDGPLPREEAAHWLTVAIEAVAENYGEYVDYNTTTTQSDRGEMLYTLLDFLRVQAEYGRVAWNLRPIALAHEVLVRCGRETAAEIWRDAVVQRTASIADEHLKRMARLVKKYGMRLRSVADRLGERFVRPLMIDRLRGLVRPAIDELRNETDTGAFARLEKEIAEFAKDVTGAGYELPSWLEALEDEVDRVHSEADDDDALDPLLRLPQVRLTLDEARRQVKGMIEGE